MDGKLSCVSHLIEAARCSLEGLDRAWHEEQAFRHEALVLGVLFLLLLLTEKSLGQTLFVLGGWLVVMSVELLNSAIENAFDLIDQEPNERVKAGKDMASAAIFLVIAVNVGLWLYVFFGCGAI